MDSRINGKYEDRDTGGFLGPEVKRSWPSLFPALFFVLVMLVALPASAELVDRIVAIVNDSVITLSEFKSAMALARDEAGNADAGSVPTDVELRSRVLDSLIEQKLVKQASDKAGIGVSEIEIDKAISSVLEKNRIAKDTLMVALAESGLTLNEYRDQLREQLREQKFINSRFRSKVMLNDEDIEEYYIQNLERYYGEPAMRLAIIFFSNSDEGLMEKRVEIVRSGLEAGEEFAVLARDYSEGPATAEGGDLGMVDIVELDGLIVSAAENLAEGDVSGPVRGSSGVTFIKVIEKRVNEPLPLEEIMEYIYRDLYAEVLEEKFTNWLKESRVLSHIEVRL